MSKNNLFYPKSKSTKNAVITVITVIAIIISALFTYGPKKIWNHLIGATDLNAVGVHQLKSTEAAKQRLRVHYIDVGQGDSTLIQFDQYNILIDCAKKTNAQNVYSYLDELDVHSLDLVIATHPDADHIGGFNDLLYQIKPKLYLLPQLPDSIERTQTELSLINTLKTLKVKTEYAVNQKQYSFGDMCLTTYITEQAHEDKNDYSIITKVSFQNTSFLFMGDAGKKVENELMEQGINLKADVLKAGHHGSSKSSSLAFVQQVNPIYCVFSCGEENEYGHPHAEVLSIMKKEKVKCLRTDENGIILIGSDGNNYYTASEKSA